MFARIAWVVACVALTTVGTSLAQDISACGAAPSENVLKEISDKTKGDIEGKAQAISKFLGSGELGGKIETERKTLYQTSDSSEAIRNDRYLFYVTCVILMKDTTASFKDKMEAIRELRKPIQAGPSKSGLMKKLLTEFLRDMPLEKVREFLGVPIGRATVSFLEGRKKRSYLAERYEGEYADVILVGNNPFRGIAVYLKHRTADGDLILPPKGMVPFPYNAIGDDDGGRGLGEITLEDLRQNCRGKLSVPDARYVYLPTPPCYFGRAGGYNNFVFSFWAGEAVESCDISPFELKGKEFGEIKCQGFWATRPDFVLVTLAAKWNGADDARSMASAVLESIYWRM